SGDREVRAQRAGSYAGPCEREHEISSTVFSRGGRSDRHGHIRVVIYDRSGSRGRGADAVTRARNYRQNDCLIWLDRTVGRNESRRARLRVVGVESGRATDREVGSQRAVRVVTRKRVDKII